jgi:hypothetical protein
MNRRFCLNLFFLLFLSAILLTSASYCLMNTSTGDELDAYRKISEHVDENELCFKCHDYTTNIGEPGMAGNADTLNLKESRIITREEFYRSNHRSLACIGCHADEDPALKDKSDAATALSRTCNDCHLYIKKHQHYQFAAIEEEYLQSVHHHKKKDEFSCWKCHDPHKSKIHYRDSMNLQEAVSYDNSICLSCHKSADPTALLANTDTTKDKVMHSWLPERDKHLNNVRCIDCHTRANTSILVAHLVLPAEESIKSCSECHFSNSLLLTTLYKNRLADTVIQSGLFNAMVPDKVFIIGANRSKLLNRVSLIIFGLTFAGIILHMIPRILRKKTKN